LEIEEIPMPALVVEKDVFHEMEDYLRNSNMKLYFAVLALFGYCFFTLCIGKVYFPVPKAAANNLYSDILLECGNVYISIVYKFQFIFCSAVSLWLIGAILVNAFC
jgi:hypothetical protein